MNSLNDIRALDGKTVLVKPAVPDDVNSVGMRGSLRVREPAPGHGLLQVEIVLSYPEMGDMAARPAHEEVIPLSQAEVFRVLASEIGGTYEFTLPGEGHSLD